MYLQAMQQANANTWNVEGKGNLLTNISRKPIDVVEEPEAKISSSSLYANISTKRMDVNEANGANSANNSGSRLVEVYEGRDVILTFVMEAYPPITRQRWTTPTHLNDTMVHQESYIANGYRLAC